MNLYSTFLSELPDWSRSIKWIPPTLQSIYINERHRILASRAFSELTFIPSSGQSRILTCGVVVETQHASGICKSKVLIWQRSHTAKTLLAAMIAMLCINVPCDCHDLFEKQVRDASLWPPCLCRVNSGGTEKNVSDHFSLSIIS